MGGREDVHDPAAHAPLPDLHHRLRALVARLLQGVEEQLPVEAVARTDPERALAEARRRGQGHVHGRRRGHHDDRLAGEETATHHGALGVALALAPAAPEAWLGFGKLVAGRPEESKILTHAVSVGHTGHQHQDGAGVRGVEVGDDEATGRAAHRGDA